MAIDFHTATVPTLTRALDQLRQILAKGAAHAEAQGWDPAVLLGMRLAPDMFPLTRQVQIATDIAKNAAARLTGTKAPVFGLIRKFSSPSLPTRSRSTVGLKSMP